MKRLKFKNPLKGLDNAKKLIPESYKVDGKEFEMTDGNETYRLKWESDLNEATVLTSSNKTQINEDMNKMKHLMGFKSQDTLGTVKGAERLEENTKFNDILGKSKKLISENSGDVEALGNAMADSAKVTAAAKKINTRDEKIEASVGYVNTVVGDDEALRNKVARQLMKGTEETETTDTSMTNEGGVCHECGDEDIVTELDNPELADLDKDGEIDSYEEKRGSAIEKAVEKDRFDEIFDGFDNDADEDDSIVDDKVEIVD